MTGERREAVKAGVFVLITMGIFVLFLVALLGKSWFERDRIYYTVFTQSVEGLEKGSSVKYLGVPAGAVDDIRFVQGDFPKILITLKIKEFVPIKEGTRATLSTTAITGIAHIELVGGSNDEQEIDEGAQIPIEPSFYQRLRQSLPQVMERLPAVLDEIQGAAANLGELFGPENRKSVAQILERLDTSIANLESSLQSTTKTIEGEFQGVAQSLQTQIEAVSKDIQGLAGNTLKHEVEATGKEIRSFLQETKGEINSTLTGFRDLTAGEDTKEIVSQLKSFASRLDQMAARVDRTLARMESALRNDEKTFTEALFHLRETVRHAEELVGRLRQDPSALLFSAPAGEREIPDPED